MKTLKTVILIVGICTCFAACKNTTNPGPNAGGVLNITNAVVGGTTITLTSNNSIASTNNTIGNNAYASLPLATGNISFNLGIPAIASTPTTPAVPAILYYQNNLDVSSGSNYSLFLTGASPSALDNILIKENYKQTYADSVCGVRIINLAPGSNPISVNLAGNPNGSEINNLAYKGYSNFVQHPAKNANSTYIFEFRDAASGTLITSYMLNTPYFHNVTLALSGTVGAVSVICDNDY